MNFCNLSNSSDLKQIICSKKNVVIQFSASWCGPCRNIKPFMEELGKTHGDKLEIVYVDVDSHGDLSQEFEVRGVPMFVFYQDGKEKGPRITGADQNGIEKKVDSMLGISSC
jgi:thioredoxin 1